MKYVCDVCGWEYDEELGDEENGINVCDTCIEKMRMSKLSFNFTCDECGEEILGKKNEVVVEGKTEIICNKCNK